MKSDATWCCPPCNQFFQTGSGLGAHFKRCHGRTAAYRYYADGSFCHGCGKQFFSSRRLLLHLKVTPQCCDRMAAAGRRQDCAQPGIRSWRRSRDDFPLCPPQRQAAPLPPAAGTERKWLDTPGLEDAFQAVLDWLVYFEGPHLGDLLQGIFNILRRFPFYTDEYRLLLRRLACTARHLVLDEGLNVWGAVGTDNVFQLLEEQSGSFHAAQLLTHPSSVECRLSWTDAQLFAASFWLSAPALVHGRPGPTLFIGEVDQRTSTDTDTFWKSPHGGALALWFENQWSECSLEEALFSCGYIVPSSLHKASLDVVTARLLLCLKEAECGGIKVALTAPCCFWQLPSALPFLGFRGVSRV